jgi:hypothetical protein
VLASEVTPGLLVGVEPNSHQFMSRYFLMGDQMDRDSGRYHYSSGTGFGMKGTKEVLI